MIYDAIVIGGGAVGCATARELSRYDLRRLHNFLYKEGRPGANGKDDDPWA